MNEEQDACTPPNNPPPPNGLAVPVPGPVPGPAPARVGAVAPVLPPPPNTLPLVPKTPPIVPEVVPPLPGMFPAPGLVPGPPNKELLVVFAPIFANGLGLAAGAPGIDEG